MFFFIIALILIAGYEIQGFYKKNQWKEILLMILISGCIAYLAYLISLPGEFSIASALFKTYQLH